MRRGRPFSPNTRRPKPYSSRGRGSTTTSKVHPYGDDWPLISKQVRVRDNFTCRASDIGLPPCNNRFPPPFHHLLHVHHIIPWHKVRNNHPKNLITLCKDCHGKEHGKNFGKPISRKQKQTMRYS